VRATASLEQWFFTGGMPPQGGINKFPGGHSTTWKVF